MPNSQIFRGGEPNDEKKAKAAVPLRGIVEQDKEAYAMGEGDRILGLRKEYSGWDVYNNEAMKVDRELVTDWTNSLNFLLIFAALFAAVLTAFIIESKKLLQPDSSNAMLDVMIFYVNNVANGTHSHYTPIEFQAQPSDITINCLFFASLSASLVAALASVVALQWVGDYDAAITRGGSSPEQRAKSRHFRHAGAVRWKMGGIIAALPLLLYASVMLFFAGLVLWMWGVNGIVGAVVAGGAAVAVLFYGGSTFLAVVFVSAPFRTPFTRWIYSVYHFPFSVLYRFIGPKPEHIPHRLDTQASVFISWLEQHHANYTISSKREDRAVEAKNELGRDALIWLAGHLNISQDSYRRLLLLVEQLFSLEKKHMPSFGPTEASWYSIFDLLGWNYLATTRVENLTPEDKHDMGILQKCYSMLTVRELMTPIERMDYITDPKRREYWSQYCGTGDEGTWYASDVPNRLFLLLRDIPVASESSPQEIEIAIRLSQWRNLTYKPPQVWDDIFSRVELLPAESPFFSSCVVTFAQFCHLPKDVVWDEEHTEIYTATMRKAIQMATTRPNFPRDATMLMVNAYESLLIGHQKKEPTISVLTNPLYYGKIIEERSATELTVHESIILLLSKQIDSCPPTERTQRAEEIISLLWLRPSHTSPRDWSHLIAHSERRTIPLEPTLVMDWVKEADQIPHVLEILQHLATAQANDESISPFLRAMDPSQYNNPHFLTRYKHLTT